MTWNVTVWNNVRLGELVAIDLDGFQRDISVDVADDLKVAAFEEALMPLWEGAFFIYGGRRELAAAMYARYRRLRRSRR